VRQNREIWLKAASLAVTGGIIELPALWQSFRRRNDCHTFASLMISNGEDIVRVSRLMGHANASFTLNVYSHMMPREHDPSGDRLASLVFVKKMETDRDAENDPGFSDPKNLDESVS
jgi:hypothetical protein